MTTDHTTLTHWQGHLSRLYLIQWFLLCPTVTCIWYSDLPQALPKGLTSEKSLDTHSSLIFRIQSQVSFKDKTAYHNVSVSGDIFVWNQLKVLVKLRQCDVVALLLLEGKSLWCLCFCICHCLCTCMSDWRISMGCISPATLRLSYFLPDLFRVVFHSQYCLSFITHPLVPCLASQKYHMTHTGIPPIISPTVPQFLQRVHDHLFLACCALSMGCSMPLALSVCPWIWVDGGCDYFHWSPLLSPEVVTIFSLCMLSFLVFLIWFFLMIRSVWK